MKTKPPPSADQRPLDFRLVRRLYAYTRPHARLRNRLALVVVLRSVQLPVVTWWTASIISSMTGSSRRLASSGSRSIRSSIELLMSANSTVICLRSPCIAPREVRTRSVR